VFNESYIIGFKEGFKIGLVWLVFSAYLLQKDRKSLLKSFYAGLIFSAVICFMLFFLVPDWVSKDFFGKVISTSFAVFLIMSAASLIHASGTGLFGKGRWYGNTTVLHTLIFLVTTVFFIPDIAGTLFFINELSFMKDGDVQTYINALTGFIIAFLIFALVIKLYSPARLGKLFDTPQFLLFLAIVKLLGSGIRGFTELSLIPSVQRGFIKFTHDFIHQVLVMHMIPDHPLLRTTTWNFIGIFFGANLASIASLIILLFCPLLFLYYSLFRPVPEPETGSGARNRKIKSITLFDRRRKALPILFFITLILFTWFLQKGETISRLFVPKPAPVVVEKDLVVIPVSSPAADLRDGALHTFSLVHEDEEIRILIVRKTDNSLSVCLDACEICPPDGYGQSADHVVCIYCGTPIHIDSLGQPGGCNPIPLDAEIDGGTVKIRLQEILDKWGFVKSGESREVIHKLGNVE
jgi:uncharacterized membrane protein